MPLRFLLDENLRGGALWRAIQRHNAGGIDLLEATRVGDPVDLPCGSLDPDTSWEIVQLLSQIHLQGTTVIVTTHDKTIVDILRKRVIALERGAVVRDEVRGRYASGG